jgi:hypothetical protein
MNNGNTNTIVLDGNLTAVSEFSTALPGGPSLQDIYNLPGVADTILGFKSAGKKTAFLPRIPKQVGGQWAYVPYVTGSSLRSALRHAAVDAIYLRLDATRFGEYPLGTDEFYLLASGGIVESGDAQVKKIKARGVNLDRPDHLRKVRADNPLLSLFGSMSARIAGRLAVGQASATENLRTAILFGVRADDLRRASDLNVERFSAEQIEEWERRLGETQDTSKRKKEIESRIKAKRKEIARMEKSGDSALAGRLREDVSDLDKQLAEAKADGSMSRLMPLPGYEVVPAGAVFSHRIGLHRATDAEVGLLFESLRVFASDFRVGAHRSLGGGVFEARYHVMVNGVNAGLLEMKDGGARFSPEDLTASFDRAWDDVDLQALVESTRKVA